MSLVDITVYSFLILPYVILYFVFSLKQVESPNPFTYGKTADAVKGGTKSMSLTNPDGTPRKVANLTEPIKLRIPSKYGSIVF